MFLRGRALNARISTGAVNKKCARMFQTAREKEKEEIVATVSIVAHIPIYKKYLPFCARLCVFACIGATAVARAWFENRILHGEMETALLRY